MNQKRLLSSLLIGAAVCICANVACSDTPTGPSGPTTTQTFVRQLQDRGVTVSIAELMPASSFPFFSVSAQRLIVNGQAVHVFEYNNRQAAQNDADRVTPSGSPIGSTQVTWIDPPRFYRSSQLIVLYVGRDTSVAAHLEAIFGAPFAGQRP